ncbi:hypothetical protein J2Z70_003604 [Paenibacillus silagei]|uniref:XRE family transcriptional regulator n=1 Tax=Paenibacillus silagei TaxID=1670801 RepID=A0ABS4NTS1_9BACL|nr:hypothetical protein [Paenibacillus silagei]
MEEKKELKDLLDHYRRVRGLSKKKLCERAEISTSYLTQ